MSFKTEEYYLKDFLEKKEGHTEDDHDRYSSIIIQMLSLEH